MSNNQTNTKGFSAVEIILVLAVIAILGFIGWLVWQNQNKTTENTPQTTQTTQQTVDPYAGWTSAGLKYEAATFKYPSTWKISNVSTPNGATGTVNPGSDKVALTSPTGLLVTIDTGLTGFGGNNKVVSSTPITTLGSEYHLNFITNGDTYTGKPTDLATGAYVNKQADQDLAFPTSKNLTSRVSGSTSPIVNSIGISYARKADDTLVQKTVADFQSDASYKEALLIIESLKY